MAVDYREVLFHLFSCLQAARLYPPEHPLRQELVNKTHRLLTDVLADQKEWTILLAGEEIVIDGEPCFDLGEKNEHFCLGLKERGLEKLTFLRGIEKEELNKFLGFIAQPQKKTSQDWVNFMQLEGIKHINAGKLAVSRGEEEEVSLFSLTEGYQNSIANLAKMMKSLRSREIFSPLELKSLVLDILEKFSGSYGQLLVCWRNLPPEQRLMAHLIHTAILVMTAAQRMGFGREDILDLGLSALVHDIGKMPGLWLKAASAENHMVAGAKLLIEHKDSLSSLPAIVALEHHLRFDLKGQPALRGVSVPHEASLIVSIANVYDGLLRKWSYDDRYDPAFVYNLMWAEKGKVFAPDWLEKFFQVMGVFPEGISVVLSQNQIGCVVRQNERAPFQPKVQVMAEEGGEVIDLAQQEGKISILRAINPFAQ